MSGGAWLSIVFVALALILPITALGSRQISAPKLLKMVAAWIAIFILVAFVISQVHPS